VCPGGSCPHSSWAAGARRPAGGGYGTGSRPASGNGCTIDCWTGWATPVRSTGHARRSTASVSGLGVGGADRRESGRPRQARLQVPPAGRWAGHPLAVALSAANTHDSTLLEQLVDAVPAVIGPRGRPGRPRRRPAKLHADKGYDFSRCRKALRRRGISPRIARRGVEPGQRLGRHRWKVEQTLAWLLGCRRLTVRYERRADLLQGLLHLACALLCLRSLRRGPA